MYLMRFWGTGWDGAPSSFACNDNTFLLVCCYCFRENDVSSKVWLKKNSLMAKRLTILDALSPTFVPHRSKYVPILDRHVVARVFDQVCMVCQEEAIITFFRNDMFDVNP